MISSSRLSTQLASWQPVSPHRADCGDIKVVWLRGKPYEMGYQHGQLLHHEIAQLPRWLVNSMTGAAKYLGLARFAEQHSFADVVEESAGLAAATADLGFTRETCLAIALGDVFQSWLRDIPPLLTRLPLDLLPINLGCSQAIASGQATVDGQLYYGVNLDCPRQPVRHWLKRTVVFLRQPLDGIPHASISVAGAVWTNSGMNLAGIVTALNSAYPARLREFSRVGHSHAQMMTQLLQWADSYEAADAMIMGDAHLATDIIGVADGHSGQAGIYELTGQHQGVRSLDHSGILYTTNHFVAGEMQPYNRSPPATSSSLRYHRFEQLMQPSFLGSRHGTIDAVVMSEIMRDRINPYNLIESLDSIYDDHQSIATNGLLRQVIFDPSKLKFWITTGSLPVYLSKLIEFSLIDLFKIRPEI